MRRVLVVRLRSIGDTVLATPSLIALRRFLPKAQIDILLEDWVAPVLEGFAEIDSVLTVKKGDRQSILQMARKIRRNRYDVAFNLHGGTTGTFFVRASGAQYRIGFDAYRYRFLYNSAYPSPAVFWQRDKVHSAEQQLALLGFSGIPVSSEIKTHLVVTNKARNSIEEKLKSRIPVFDSRIALLHPASAFETKQWAAENFAQVAEFLHEKGFTVTAVAAKNEMRILEKLIESARVPITAFDNLTLPEITALAARSSIFVGNDSGIAHIAAAVETPTVVIFGSSNIVHWRPWSNAPNEIVYEAFACQPCAGYACQEFSEPRCILSVPPEKVFTAIEKVLQQAEKK